MGQKICASVAPAIHSLPCVQDHHASASSATIQGPIDVHEENLSTVKPLSETVKASPGRADVNDLLLSGKMRSSTATDDVNDLVMDKGDQKWLAAVVEFLENDMAPDGAHVVVSASAVRSSHHLPRLDKESPADEALDYCGQLCGRQRHGFGRQRWSDGTAYEGEWLQGEASGRGRIIYADGQVYIGEWIGGHAHGHGISKHRGRSSFSGQWEVGLRHGRGVEIWGLHGRGRYEGEFSHGLREGFGICTWPDGFTYTGRWRGDCIDGPGICIGSDGRIYPGRWRGGALDEVGACVWPDPDGKAYQSLALYPGGVSRSSCNEGGDS